MGARGIVRMSASRMGDRVLVDRSVAGVVHVWMGCADRIRARVMGISAALEHVMQTELETVRARAGNLVARRGVLVLYVEMGIWMQAKNVMTVA